LSERKLNESVQIELFEVFVHIKWLAINIFVLLKNKIRNFKIVSFLKFRGVAKFISKIKYLETTAERFKKEVLLRKLIQIKDFVLFIVVCKLKI